MSIVAPWEARALTIIPPQPKRPIRLEGLSLQRGERGCARQLRQRLAAHIPPRTPSPPWRAEERLRPLISICKQESRDQVLCRDRLPRDRRAGGAGDKIEQLRTEAEMAPIIAESLMSTARLETANKLCLRVMKQGTRKR